MSEIVLDLGNGRTAACNIAQVTGGTETADQAYNRFCEELGISNSSISSFNSDDAAWLIDTGWTGLETDVGLMDSRIQYASEGSFGMFLDGASINNSRTYYKPNGLSRMYCTSTKPHIWFTHHYQSDLRSEYTKLASGAGGFALYAKHRKYNSSSYSYYVAIKVEPGKITYYVQGEYASYVPIMLMSHDDSGSLLTTHNLGNIYGGTTVTFEFAKADYYTTGEYTLAPIKINEFTAPIDRAIDSKLTWAESTEEGITSAAIYTAITDVDVYPAETDFIETSNGSPIPSIAQDMDLTAKWLWIKAALSTSDVTKSPTVSDFNLMLQNYVDKSWIVLYLSKVYDASNALTDIYIDYDMGKSLLSGQDALIESFSTSIPNILIKDLRPEAVREKTHLKPSMSIVMTPVNYSKAYNGQQDKAYISMGNITIDFINASQVQV